MFAQCAPGNALKVVDDEISRRALDQRRDSGLQRRESISKRPSPAFSSQTFSGLRNLSSGRRRVQPTARSRLRPVTTATCSFYCGKESGCCARRGNTGIRAASRLTSPSSMPTTSGSPRSWKSRGCASAGRIRSQSGPHTDALVFDEATRRTICRIGKRIHLHEGDILQPLLLRCFIASATPVVKRSVLVDAGLFDETRQRRVIEDWSLWLRIAPSGTR